jgi:hypothetical protein
MDARRQAREQIRRDVERIKRQIPIPKVTQENLEELQAAEEQETSKAETFGPLDVGEAGEPSAPKAPIQPKAQETQKAQKDTETGWDQGDGRWAFQLVAHESLSPAQKARLQLVKGTHFRFQPNDEANFLEALQRTVAHAEYHPKGKKDVTLTNAGGSVIGQIHLLHVDKKDLHRPEAYYMKFYLYNVEDKGTLDAIATAIRSFMGTWSTGQAQPHKQPLGQAERQKQPLGQAQPHKQPLGQAERQKQPLGQQKPQRPYKTRRNNRYSRNTRDHRDRRSIRNSRNKNRKLNRF